MLTTKKINLRHKPSECFDPNRRSIFIFLLLFVLFFSVKTFGQATITIEVNWPNWSSENRVTLYDPANNQIGTSICNPTACFNGAGDNPYNNLGSPATFTGLAFGDGYSILMEDSFGDGWNGTGAYVKVYVDGILVLENDGQRVIVNGNIFNLPRTLTFGVYSNPTIFNGDLISFDEKNGYFDYAETGNSLRTSPNTGDPCAITTSSSGTLSSSIPGTATIERAYLYWASSGVEVDTQVSLDAQTVNADQTYRTYLTSNEGYFTGAIADVTDIVIAAPDDTFDFSGLTIDNSLQYCTNATVLGGWSLIVFYTDDSLPASTIIIYNGFKGDSGSLYPGGVATSTFTLSGFYAIGSSDAKTSVLSWEGDQTLANNESLTFTTLSSGTNELVGDGDNDGIVDNPFNSTFFDNSVAPVVNVTTTYGMDLDTYDVSSFISASETSATTTVNVGQDYVIMNTVILKVPSNLIVGSVFEDINYGGGIGRNFSTSSGTGVNGAVVELYDNSGVLIRTTNTDLNGDYLLGGMANGTYSLRVVNGSVKSTRLGGDTCTTCLPVQTFKTNFSSSTLTEIVNEVGGANPSGTDTGIGVLSGAQTISSVSIASEGAIGMDFGFNFNTIVNTNDSGQGSLSQFIENANNLGNTGLDIEANSIFDPAVTEDTSIFMIPSSADPLGRTVDGNYASGIFTIDQNSLLPEVTDANTHIDGRTQTAYSGDTNSGTTGGGVAVGTSATVLPSYANPEIQVQGSTVAGDIFRVSSDGSEIRNLAIYSLNNQDAIHLSGTINTSDPIIITENFIGPDAQGNLQSTLYGIEIESNSATNIDSNYIAHNSRGMYINGGVQTEITLNHFDTNNPSVNCFYDAITLDSGSGVEIEYNMIENSGAHGIDMVHNSYSGNTLLNQNTITSSGQSTSGCIDPWENYGVSVTGSNNTISGNVIFDNPNSGIVVDWGGTSNLITQNSIYNNGTVVDALGIDLGSTNVKGPNGVTINDLGDNDNGPNDLSNFPVFETITTDGINLTLKGWARPGTIIELFVSDITEGTAIEGDNQLGLTKDYGEGQTYLTTLIEGSASDLNAGTGSYTDADANTDNTNRFEFTIPLPSGVSLGYLLTGTGTIGNNTSEFSPITRVNAKTVITNRRITYRVKKN